MHISESVKRQKLNPSADFADLISEFDETCIIDGGFPPKKGEAS
jgi:hypothetical protein